MKERCFPSNPTQAMLQGFANAENKILERQTEKKTCIYLQAYFILGEIIDRSGSCAVTAMFVGENCYIANVGDSRAILASDSCTSVCALTKDHKPDEENETKRIREAGGQIYQ